MTRRNFPPDTRIAPGVYRIDYDRYGLRVVIKDGRGRRLVDETRVIKAKSPELAVAERERWAADLRAPYTPVEVLDTRGRLLAVVTPESKRSRLRRKPNPALHALMEASKPEDPAKILEKAGFAVLETVQTPLGTEFRVFYPVRG